jgi:hypothetical protein
MVIGIGQFQDDVLWPAVHLPDDRDSSGRQSRRPIQFHDRHLTGTEYDVSVTASGMYLGLSYLIGRVSLPKRQTAMG